MSIDGKWNWAMDSPDLVDLNSVVGAKFGNQNTDDVAQEDKINL
jgi:hypothetical protein